ncbi:MAG TPA: NfeD family protein [Xanthobacteraceae bacterium]|nr:NfeD family protein [Xanthobacteraceae bacterium]
MLDYLAGLGIWNWFILGALLLALEVLVPGTFMLWLGLSAIAVGMISLVVDWPWQAQLIAFSVLSIASIMLWRRLSPPGSDEAPPQPFLNRRAEGFVGRTFTLERPIVDMSGSVRIGDTIWQVRGPDAPAGSRVTVTGAEGGTLIVSPTDG